MGWRLRILVGAALLGCMGLFLLARWLVEPPHIHVSMAFVPDGDPCPLTGEWVDVQRPLIATQVDRIDWLE